MLSKHVQSFRVLGASGVLPFGPRYLSASSRRTASFLQHAFLIIIFLIAITHIYGDVKQALRVLRPIIAKNSSIPFVQVRCASTETTSTSSSSPLSFPFEDIPENIRRKIAGWLFFTAGMVFCMVVLGGVTRLTESGLSITEWKPVTGSIPPLSEADWESEFNKYKQSPEFKILKSSITLSEFKRIYYYEWAHRFLGRTIGVVFALPFAYFASRGYLNASLKKRLGVLLGLGGMQGFIGWWMVKSGLQEGLDHPRVSPYRLATHLGTAFVLYMGILHTALSLTLPHGRLAASKAVSPYVYKGAHYLTQMTFFTAIAGAFVAGLDAGLVYPQFPYMGDKRFTPVEYWEHEPAWKNLFENPAAVQFNHRLLAMATYTGATVYYLWARKQPLSGQPRVALHALIAMANLQVALGIATLLYYVPTPLAATHQAGSLTLLSISLWLSMLLRRIPRLPA